MCLVIVIGWVIAGVIWHFFGPVWGVIAVVLATFAGPAWNLVFGKVGVPADGSVMLPAFSPLRRQFKKAWRKLDCDNVDGLGPRAYEVNQAIWVSRYRDKSAAAYLRPWVDCTKEDYSSFRTAWDQSTCPIRCGEGEFDHWLYEWLVVRGSYEPIADPVKFIASQQLSLDMRRRSGG